MYTKKLLWLLPLFITAACGSAPNNKESTSGSSRADTAVAAVASQGSYNAPLPLSASERKIVRTADFHCKVENVFASVNKLEQLVKANGGIVQDSRLENISSEIKTSYYKPDSLKQMQTYTTTALLTLKVPYRQLDSVTGAIPGMTIFIDSRTLRQSDVTYQYMANELKNKIGESGTTANALKLARKSKEAIETDQYETGKQEQQIARRIDNMQLMDDVTYATITVAFSQPEQVFMQTIINPEYVTSLPFNTRVHEAINSGSATLSEIAVALISIWPLILLSVAGWIIYRKMRQRKVNPVIRPA